MTENVHREWCWPFAHDWAKWRDKTWSRLLRDYGNSRTTTSTAPESEVGLECVQERRCKRCNQLQLRSEQVRV